MSRLNILLEEARSAFSTATHVIISPYRISPIGAHIDHQGGAVLGRTIDMYTVLAFEVVENSAEITLTCHPTISQEAVRFSVGEQELTNWGRYAQAAAAALQRFRPMRNGLRGYINGSLLGAGLSSSASVILAYLHALALANDINFIQAESVELARRVENEFLGLNNGIQDQTAIAFGQKDALLHMDVRRREVTPILDPPTVRDVCWLLAYSGYSRELLGSGFNTRVAECREAAQLLESGAKKLGDVVLDKRNEAQLALLPIRLARRARHVFTEIDRVAAGRVAWECGNWREFGRIMNQSCRSSITQYESGSQPLIDLQEIALQTNGVYGSRFSGGGYGGCLIMLAERAELAQIIQSVKSAYLEKHPNKRGVADVFCVQPENSVVIKVLDE